MSLKEPKFKPLPLTPPWSKALCLVCTKCCEEKGLELATALKAHMKSLSPSREIRVSKCGCLDICPENKIVIAITSPTQPIKTFEVNPEISMKKLENLILEKS